MYYVRALGLMLVRNGGTLTKEWMADLLLIEYVRFKSLTE